MRVSFVTFCLLLMPFSVSAAVSVRHYSGMIQVTELGKAGPAPAPYTSIVRRIVDNGKITECVFQHGKMIVAEMTASHQPLVFDVNDSAKAYSGKLIFADNSLMSWTYDIDVPTPKGNGKITGSGVIDEKNETMMIKKVWNQRTLIDEFYALIEENRYLLTIGQAPAPKICR